MKLKATLSLLQAIIGFSLPVQTTSGLVVGHAASDAFEVSEYLGVPYAVPPIGSLRFQPPVRYTGNGTHNATTFGPSCIQPPVAPPTNDTNHAPPQDLGVPPSATAAFASEVYPANEDCLTLNIWTKPQIGEEKKAVLVWVYGGAYVSGSTRLPTYRGQFIAEQTDVVVVSINYRVNIFGFPGNPTTPANLGLRDLRMSIEWVRDNIKLFGGDPERITLFGQSAGAGMVDFYSFAYPDDPIVSGFIEMSATIYGFPALTEAETNDRWFHVTNLIGCGNATSDDLDAVTNCMMRKTVDEILAGYDPASVPITPSPYGPVIDNELVFSSYMNRTAARGGYLIGNTENEAGLFKLLQAPQNESYWTDFNNRLYTCANIFRIKQSVAQGNPAWRYRYFGDFPNLVLTTTPPSGAYHTAELGPLFDTVNQSLLASTPAEVSVGIYLRNAWSSFAKDPQRGLDSFWPRYSENGTERTLARIGFHNKTVSLAPGNMYDNVCRWSYDGVSAPAPLPYIHSS
ncbi:Alpha/Beta hydrolase protein [Aspergillus pseudoustus]|uniref:Carboxylic ester hydrolase n=1 Tax=Aspergillus pseudoustus TaxID=1810923 RepID=A0ABR4JWC1_9EURO